MVSVDLLPGPRSVGGHGDTYREGPADLSGGLSACAQPKATRRSATGRLADLGPQATSITREGPASLDRLGATRSRVAGDEGNSTEEERDQGRDTRARPPSVQDETEEADDD